MPHWTSTCYDLTDEQAELFRLLDERIRELGQVTSKAKQYIAYKREHFMKGAFVRISKADKRSLNVHLPIVSRNDINDPLNLCTSDNIMSHSWSRAQVGGLAVKCTPESDIDYIMDLVRQTYRKALVYDEKRIS